MISTADRERQIIRQAERDRRILQRLNRRPMPVKWQLTVFAVLSAAAIVVGAVGWMCRH